MAVQAYSAGGAGPGAAPFTGTTWPGDRELPLFFWSNPDSVYSMDMVGDKDAFEDADAFGDMDMGGDIDAFGDMVALGEVGAFGDRGAFGGMGERAHLRADGQQAAA